MSLSEVVDGAVVSASACRDLRLSSFTVEYFLMNGHDVSSDLSLLVCLLPQQFGLPFSGLSRFACRINGYDGIQVRLMNEQCFNTGCLQ
jgi:hypothetical protein